MELSCRYACLAIKDSTWPEMHCLMQASQLEDTQRPREMHGDLPQCRHCHDGVPECSWNGSEVGVINILLCVEHDGGEDYDGHGEGENEEAKLGGARLEGVAQDPETLRMPRELEDAEHSEHPEGHEGAGHVVIVSDSETYVVRQDGHHVDDAHHTPDKFATVGSCEQPEEILRREDHDASRVKAKEDDLIALATRQGAGPTRPVSAGNSLYHVGHHGHSYEEARHVVEDEGRRGCVRVLEGSPHLLTDVRQLLQVLVPVLRQLVVHQPLCILPLPVPVVFVTAVADDVRKDAEKCQLFVITRQALVFWVVQFPRAIVVENVTKYIRVTIEEVLLTFFVIEKLPFVRS